MIAFLKYISICSCHYTGYTFLIGSSYMEKYPLRCLMGEERKPVNVPRHVCVEISIFTNGMIFSFVQADVCRCSIDEEKNNMIKKNFLINIDCKFDVYCCNKNLKLYFNILHFTTYVSCISYFVHFFPSSHC